MRHGRRQSDSPLFPRPSQALNPKTPRRRAHDVVIWQEGDEYVVYDSVANSVFRGSRGEAWARFEAIKKANRDANLI